MVDPPSFTDEIRAVGTELRVGDLTPARLNHAGVRIDQLGRRVHGLGWVRDHEIGVCLTVAVRELIRARGLADLERAQAVRNSLDQLEIALALSDEGLRPPPEPPSWDSPGEADR